MEQRMKMHKRLFGMFTDTKTACGKCGLRKAETCPYLEEVANCRLFKKLEGGPIGTLLLRHAS